MARGSSGSVAGGGTSEGVTAIEMAGGGGGVSATGNRLSLKNTL